MSASLLEKVTQGPWRVCEPGSNFGKGKKYIRPVDDGKMIATVSGDWRWSQNEANAQLIALAYDHALWGAATSDKTATVSQLTLDGHLRIEVRTRENGEWVRYETKKDPFGCPVLTPELRAALRAALGMEARDAG